MNEDTELRDVKYLAQGHRANDNCNSNQGSLWSPYSQEVMGGCMGWQFLSLHTHRHPPMCAHAHSIHTGAHVQARTVRLMHKCLPSLLLPLCLLFADVALSLWDPGCGRLWVHPPSPHRLARRPTRAWLPAGSPLVKSSSGSRLRQGELQAQLPGPVQICADSISLFSHRC